MKMKIIGLIAACRLLFFIPPATAERVFFAGYKGGFYIKSEEEGGMELRLGGSFQADYQHFLENGRADNGFDIRRARLIFNGQLTRWFKFGLEYELQGNEIKHLVDAYGEAVIFGAYGLRFGQFKEPFGLEWQTKDKGLYFAERSMGYYLTPKRDIGAMFHGSFFKEVLHYGIGMFNGDGVDGSAGGEQDDPEFAARMVFTPFKHTSVKALNGLQIGGAATWADIDLSNVNVGVKTAGMAGTNRNIYVLKDNTKFGVLRDVDSRKRLGMEAGWTSGPVAITGEYIHLEYEGLKPAGEPARNAEFSAWYAGFMVCLTGEQFSMADGVMKPLYPSRFFNPGNSTWGAWVLALRAEHFSGDADWIKKDAGVSVEGADGFSAALNWILFPMTRVIFDYTRTEFTDPVRVRVNSDGQVDYVDEENVVSLRLSMDF